MLSLTLKLDLSYLYGLIGISWSFCLRSTCCYKQQPCFSPLSDEAFYFCSEKTSDLFIFTQKKNFQNICSHVSWDRLGYFKTYVYCESVDAIITLHTFCVPLIIDKSINWKMFFLDISNSIQYSNIFFSFTKYVNDNFVLPISNIWQLERAWPYMTVLDEKCVGGQDVNKCTFIRNHQSQQFAE
jgi:hypothetical protein